MAGPFVVWGVLAGGHRKTGQHAPDVETVTLCMAKIIPMAGVQGAPHPKTMHFNRGRDMRATVVLKPGEQARVHYEELVRELNVSGAQVLREALAELHRKLLPQQHAAQEKDPEHAKSPGSPARAPLV